MHKSLKFSSKIFWVPHPYTTLSFSKWSGIFLRRKIKIFYDGQLTTIEDKAVNLMYKKKIITNKKPQRKIVHVHGGRLCTSYSSWCSVSCWSWCSVSCWSGFRAVPGLTTWLWWRGPSSPAPEVPSGSPRAPPPPLHLHLPPGQHPVIQ